MAEPSAPDAETRSEIDGVLGELIARGGAGAFLLSPVEPGERAFPEPWAATAPGMQMLIRRLCWHAGVARDVVIDDRRADGAPPTERKPATRVAAIEVRKKEAVFELGFVGTDDVAGTAAHEVGVVYAMMNRRDGADPYRSAEAPVITLDPDRDLERGSIAAVYLGLGVLAANAAYQQYSRGGDWAGGYQKLEYDVLRAGYLPMSALAYLLAVQAVVRGDDAPPRGLKPPQRDEVSGWIGALKSRASELRERLGIAPGDVERAREASRPAVEPFEAIDLQDSAPAARTAFRWHTNRGGVGLIGGTLFGIGIAVAIARGMPWIVVGGATGGHVVGRRVRVPRCSACATIVSPNATTCRNCGAALRGDIAHLSERLDAEERLGE